VIPEHRVCARQHVEQPSQPWLGARPGEEVPGDERQIGLPGGRPVHGAVDSVLPARGEAEMEVRQVHDAKPHELRRQARHWHVERAQPHPAGLEKPPGRNAEAESTERNERLQVFLDLELVKHGLDRDHVPLELELGVLEPRRDADQLREVEDRHVEVAAGPLAQLRLPRIE
jgi:hypothetical protein